MSNVSRRCLRRRIQSCFFLLLILAFCVCFLQACDTAKAPEYARVIELSGTPYERGFQHGELLSSEIRSFYTTLLTTGMLPYLNREQPEVASFLTEYQKEEYQDGQFSYKMLFESGENLLTYAPQDYIEELRGLSDGSEIPFDDIVVLNTFVDTMLAFRGITFYIKAFQSPLMVNALFHGNLEADGVDNDDDGLIDEENEGLVEPYNVVPHALMTEVPPEATLQFELLDFIGNGVNPDSIRVQLNETVYTAEDDCITSMVMGDPPNGMTVFFTPPGGFEPASVVAIILSAGDLDDTYVPPVPRHRYMRDERIIFTTKGYGAAAHDVPNIGFSDGRSQPPALAFAVRNSATENGNAYLAHHFALLDSGTSQKHTVLFAHKPENGIPHVTLSWAGVIGGFSGMNAEGLSFAVNLSDTLDNPLVNCFNEDNFKAKLIGTGVPLGVMGRELLTHHKNVEEGTDYLYRAPTSFGWNFLLTDKNRQMNLIEMDSNILEDPDEGFYVVSPDRTNPDNLDPWYRPLASVGPDDLRTGSHYVANTEDIDKRMLVVFHTRAQRLWSSYFNRSVSAVTLLGQEIERRYGLLDVPGMIDILRVPELIDVRDSMNAVVYEPEQLRMHYAMGMVPSTKAEFRKFDLGAFVAEEEQQ